MDSLYQNVLMTIGSSVGIAFVYIAVCTLYVSKKTDEYTWFLWMVLLPFLPMTKFLFLRKSKKTWAIFVIMMAFYLYFSLNLEPSIASQRISQISFYHGEETFVITKEDRPTLITNIKWEMYKADLLWNLGINRDAFVEMEKVDIILRNGSTVIAEYPIRDILEVILKDGASN